MQSNLWPLFSRYRCKRSEKVICCVPMAMLYPGCSLTSAPAAPRTWWSPDTVTACAHPDAHHPHSREYLCARLQSHNRHHPHAKEHKKERLRVLERSQVAAGFSPHNPWGWIPHQCLLLTHYSSWQDSTPMTAQHTPFEGGQHYHMHSDL